MMRIFIIATTVAAALFGAPAFTQERSRGAESLPDFSGFWGNPYLYGIEPPLSGHGPVVNTSRRRQTLDADGRPLTAANAPLVSEATRLVGDYTNPILTTENTFVAKINLWVRTLVEFDIFEIGAVEPAPGSVSRGEITSC
jgi:hypothetical protein